jgi:hypothetical protein
MKSYFMENPAAFVNGLSEKKRGKLVPFEAVLSILPFAQLVVLLASPMTAPQQ